MVNTMRKKQLNTLKNNFKHLLLYEFCYLLVVSLVVVPAVMYLYTTCIKNQNISSLPILVFSLLVIFLIIFLLFNKIILVTSLDNLHQKKKVSKKEIFLTSISRLSTLLKKKNILYFLLYLLFTTFLYLTMFEYFTIHYLKLLNIELDIILAIILVYTIIILSLFKYIFFSHYLILENRENKKYLKSSSRLIKTNISRDIANVLGVNLIMVPVLLITLIIADLAVTTPFLSSSLMMVNITWIVLWSLIILAISIYVVLVNSVMSMMFYKHKSEKNEVIVRNKKVPSINWSFIPKIIKVTVIIFALLLSSYSISQEIEKSMEEPHKVEIIGHRGASVDYPENTIAAFKGAKLEGANWIELDVRQTRDGKYVIHHDETTYRITGRHWVIADTEYKYLCRLDCGSFFDEKYSGEKMPLLEDVIKLAKKNNIKIVIELKNNPEEINYYEGDIVKLIHKYNFTDSCIVESPIYKQLRNIKRLDPNIQTAFLTETLSEEYLNLEDIDVFAIDFVNLNSYWIDRIHEKDKKVIAWTINDAETMKQFLYLKVDSIATDNINLAQEVLKEWEEETTDSNN